MNSRQDLFRTYGFNPFQFGASDRESKHLHKLMARYFINSSYVLDLGCGKGDFLLALKNAGKRGFGIDTYDEAIEKCSTIGVDAEKYDVRQFIEDNGGELSRFDGIYCAHLIEHLAPEMVFELLASLFKNTRAGTQFVFVTPNYEDLTVSGQSFWLDLTHVRPYPGILVQRVLESIGFRNVEHQAIYGLGFSIAMVKKYLLQKIRFGDRIYKPNLVITAIR
jgi:2-polyprenyl-3-methyl-5-hydroxy-6-metoxy-1,4-benzoquinol methylase